MKILHNNLLEEHSKIYCNPITALDGGDVVIDIQPQDIGQKLYITLGIFDAIKLRDSIADTIDEITERLKKEDTLKKDNERK